VILHFKLLEYSLSSLWRRKEKNIALVVVYALVIATLGSVLLLTHALKTEAVMTLIAAPDIVVQRTQGGRHELIPIDYAKIIADFPGVGRVTPRVWGYYYDSLVKANLTLIGLTGYHEQLALLEGRFPQAPDECVIGAGVADAFGPGIGDLLVLEDSSKRRSEFRVSGIFRSASSLLTNDLVVLDDAALRDFFAMPDGMATDLTVQVYNSREISTIAKKIAYFLPDSRPITREELLHTYDSLFNWRSGMMLAVFVSALMAFLILAWDRATGISAEEKREIGILKALGWETSHVLGAKLREALLISLTAFIAGLLLAWLHVFVLGAPLLMPLLKGWSVLFPTFDLPRVVDLYQLAVLGCVTILPYLASTLIPAWKAASSDPDDVMRG
jgi:ABC-type antimicrobial peptide transport system permease subunit